MIPFIFHTSAVAFSLSTASSVFLHDMYIDQATQFALTAAPAIATTHETVDKSLKFSDPHTHGHHGSLSQYTRDLKNQTPRVNPRTNDDKKRRHIKEKLYLAHALSFSECYEKPLMQNL